MQAVCWARPRRRVAAAPAPSAPGPAADATSCTGQSSQACWGSLTRSRLSCEQLLQDPAESSLHCPMGHLHAKYGLKDLHASSPPRGCLPTLKQLHIRARTGGVNLAFMTPRRPGTDTMHAYPRQKQREYPTEFYSPSHIPPC